MILVPGHAEWRPQWWTVQMEIIIKVVRKYREDSGIPYGGHVSELECLYEEGGGFVLFSTLARTPDFIGAWKDLQKPDLLFLVRGRALGGPPHPLGCDKPNVAA